MLHGQLSDRSVSFVLHATLQHRLITTGVPMSFTPVRRPQIAVAAFALVVAVAPLVRAQQPATAKGPSRQMQPADLKAWKGIRQPVLSNDGKWFAYVLAPNEGDASVIIRSTGADAKEMKFPIGDPGGATNYTVASGGGWKGSFTRRCATF